MPHSVQQVRIFLASPGDVNEERDRAEQIINELQLTLGDREDLHLRPIRWENDAYPALGRVQGVVNRQLRPEESDIFVGILWNRLGTPTGHAASGTVEEFQRAYDAWRQRGRPPILFYFCERPADLRTEEALQQKMKVVRFRNQFPNKGLYGTYTLVDDFERQFRRGLEQTIYELLNTLPDPSPPSSSSASSSVRGAPGQGAPSSSSSFDFGDISVPDVRVPASDLDKRTFLREGFATIATYFEAGAEQLDSHEHVNVTIDRIDTRTFVAEAFVRGQRRSRCKVWIGGMMSENSIAYAEGPASVGRGNSMNDFVTVDDDRGALAFRASGMGFGSMAEPGTRLDAKEAAAYFWRRFIRPLEQA
jgi:hypothetical protein